MSAAPASVAEPAKVRMAPSFPVWFAPALATGATLLMVAVSVSVPVPPSPSVTVRVTVKAPLSA